MEIREGRAKWAFTGCWSGVVAGLVVAGHVLGVRESTVRLTRMWARNLAEAWGLVVVTEGAEHVPPGGPVVFMPNHQSYADIIALVVALPQLPGFLAKKELRKIPVFGAAMEAAGHVFIDRSSRSDAFRSIDEAAAAVRAGRSIVVFPEGTRAQGDVIGPFKKGGFHLARRAEVPIIPIGIRGTRAIWNKGAHAIASGTVTVRIGPPVAAADVVALQVDELVARVRTEITALSAQA